MFAVEIAGATDVKYVPGYFPFTEPSIEVHIKHPVLGWFELGGSGIFRPEVTKAMGVDVPVPRCFPARRHDAPPTSRALLRRMEDAALAELAHVHLGNV